MCVSISVTSARRTSQRLSYSGTLGLPELELTNMFTLISKVAQLATVE